MNTEKRPPDVTAPKSFGPRQNSRHSNRFTLIFIPNESGASKKFTLPKSLLYVAFICSFALVGAFSGMCIYVRKMSKLNSENEKLKAENHSIRSEATALISKLKLVQDNLTRVDKFSNQVFEEASQIDPKEAKSQKVKNGLNIIEKQQKKSSGNPKSLKNGTGSGTTSLQLPKSVGPLTKEEFAFSKNPKNVAPISHGADIKANKLEFKSLFDQMQNLQSESSEQATSLQLLLNELQTYRSKLAAAPTLPPVNGHVTSQYGWRVSPITGQNRMHQGLDIAAPLGSPIHAAAQGTIVKVANADDYGNFVELSHGFGVKSRYAHALSISVKVGQKVKKGEVIGKVGMTGRTTGPHLHYELEIGGRKVDPSGFLMSMGK